MNRTYSLKRHKEFRYTYRNGKRVNSACFTLISVKNRTDKLQVGFSVSKKIGNAVRRNRCKRRLKACFAGLLPVVREGSNLIFVAKKEALSVRFSDMQDLMLKAIKKAGLYLSETVL